MDTSTVYAIACLLAAVPITIGGAYLYLKRLYGDEIVKQLPLANFISVALLLLGLVGVVSLSLLVARSNFETTLTILWLVGLVVFWISLLISLWRRPTLGSIVVELDPPSKTSNWVIGFFAVGGILSVLLLLTSERVRASALFVLSGLSMLTWSVSYYLQNKRKTRFTETGIHIGDAAIKWERIKTFHWLEGRSAETAMLHLQTRGLFSLPTTSILRIPAQHKDAINDLLTRHVSN